jgi:hypothetical protein
MLGFERELWGSATFLTLPILGIASLTTIAFALLSRESIQTPKPSILWGLGRLSRRHSPLRHSHPVTEIAISRHSKANWLNLRGVFHGDVRCVTKRQPASELAVAILEVSEGRTPLSTF